MTNQLPLQTILHFQPPKRQEAIAYLDSISRQSGIADSGYAECLYQRSFATQPDLLDQALPPNGSEWLAHFDLRKAIMQMQLERGEMAEGLDRPPDCGENDLQTAARKLDMTSFTDAWIEERPWARMEVSPQYPTATCADSRCPRLIATPAPPTTNWGSMRFSSPNSTRIYLLCLGMIMPNPSQKSTSAWEACFNPCPACTRNGTIPLLHW